MNRILTTSRLALLGIVLTGCLIIARPQSPDPIFRMDRRMEDIRKELSEHRLSSEQRFTRLESEVAALRAMVDKFESAFWWMVGAAIASVVLPLVVGQLQRRVELRRNGGH